MIKKLSIVILNWNGKELLAENLHSVIFAAENSQNDVEILVVDNGSTDGSVEFVKSNYPQVRVLSLDKNYGFGEGNNIGVKEAKGDVIILLNNDMSVDKDFIAPLLKPFEDVENVFAVGSQIFFQDKNKRRQETGKTFAYWDKGIIRYLHQDVTDLDVERKYIPVFWASAGAVAYQRKKFLELGGFQSLYSPAYVEDVDISYRAWKRGWKTLFSTNSIVYHKHRASSSKRFSEVEIEILNKRNHLFFIWSNISSKKMLFEHIVSHCYRLMKNFIKDRNKIELRSFLKALPNYFYARKLNKNEKKYSVSTDKDLLKRCKWKRDFIKEQKKLSILFICPYVPCVGVHATGNRMYLIAKELSKKNDVSVLTFIEKSEEEKYIKDLISFCKNVTFILRRQSLDEPDYFHIIPNMVLKEFCQPEMKETLCREILSGKYDVVQFEYLQMAYLAKYIDNIGIPILWVDHEVQHSALWREFKLQKIFSWQKVELFFRWMVMLNFELTIVKRMKNVITVTINDSKELLIYQPKTNNTVIPLGVDFDYFSPNNTDNKRNNQLIFTGYFLHLPNVDAVYNFVGKIYPIIRKRIPDVTFYVVGSSPPPEIMALSKNDGIVVTGWVPDIRPYLESSSVYVAPIRLGVGFRGKLLEAFAMKIPVVATNLAVQGIPVEHNKNVLISDNHEEFAEFVISLLVDKSKRISLSNEAYNIALKNYSWKQISDLNEKAIYDSIDTLN